MIRGLDIFHKCICTDSLQSHPGMDLVNLYRKLIFDPLDLEKEGCQSSNTIKGQRARSNLAADF